MFENASTRAHVLIPAPIAADHHPAKNMDSRAPGVSTSNNSDFDPDSAPDPIIPISRKDRRKQKKGALIPPSDPRTPPSSDTESARKRKTPPNNPPPRTRSSSPSIALSLESPMPAASNAAQKAYPLLICSLGNPGSTYAHTLHSAGHTITSHIASVKGYRPFTKGLSGLVARPDNTAYSFGLIRGFTKTNTDPPEDDWTFWQSTSLMNVSGKGVKNAWTEFRAKMLREGRGEARLVVVHDELESALGKVTVRDGASSAKGHNGLKSCQASLGRDKWWRVGVGIGRPESRDPDVVARYVLKKMNAGEMKAMEKACGSVVALLREISEGKR